MNNFVNLALDRHRVLLTQNEINRLNKVVNKENSLSYVVFCLVALGIILSILGVSWIWSASLISVAGGLMIASIGFLFYSRRLLIRNIADLNLATTNYMDHVGFLLKNHGFAPEFTVVSDIEDEIHSILGTKDGDPKVMQVAFIGAEAKVTLVESQPGG